MTADGQTSAADAGAPTVRPVRHGVCPRNDHTGKAIRMEPEHVATAG